MCLSCGINCNNIDAQVNYLYQQTYLLFLLDWLMEIETAEGSLAEKGRKLRRKAACSSWDRRGLALYF